MNSVGWSVCALVLVSSWFHAVSGYPEQDDVLLLTKDNFDAAIAEFKYLLVDFYAPWCGHCKKLAPEYSKAAKQLKEEGSEIRFASVDATEEKELAERYEVRGYPTLHFFRNSTPVEYTSNSHEAADIILWCKKKTGQAWKNIGNLRAAVMTISREEFLVYGFFKDVESEGARNFKKVAESIDDLLFAISDFSNILNKYRIVEDTVSVFRKFDETRLNISGDLSVEAITNFIDINRLPILIEFNDETASKIFARKLKKHVILFVSQDADHYDSSIQTMKEVAPMFKGQAMFIHVNVDVSGNKRVLDYFHVNQTDAPTIRMVNLDGQIRYKPEQKDITVEGVKNFVQGVLNGAIKQHLMSDEIPEDWSDRPVKILVGKNFEEVAYDKTKNVFVNFYAPWCGFSKDVLPIWDELGEKYKDHPDLVIAKMDATANEVEGVKISKFPALKYFHKDNNEVTEFPFIHTYRTLDKLSKFIEDGGIYIAEAKEDKTEATKEEAKKEEAKKEETTREGAKKDEL